MADETINIKIIASNVVGKKNVSNLKNEYKKLGDIASHTETVIGKGGSRGNANLYSLETVVKNVSKNLNGLNRSSTDIKKTLNGLNPADDKNWDINSVTKFGNALKSTAKSAKVASEAVEKVVAPTAAPPKAPKITPRQQLGSMDTSGFSEDDIKLQRRALKNITHKSLAKRNAAKNIMSKLIDRYPDALKEVIPDPKEVASMQPKPVDIKPDGKKDSAGKAAGKLSALQKMEKKYINTLNNIRAEVQHITSNPEQLSDIVDLKKQKKSAYRDAAGETDKKAPKEVKPVLSEEEKYIAQRDKAKVKKGFAKTYDAKELKEETKGLNRVSASFHKISKASNKLGSQKNQFQRIGWGFTMMSLSALGVYFSMFGLVNIFKAATSALFGQLIDLDGAFEGLANTIAFGGEKGKEIIDILGGEDSVIDGIVNGWQNVLGVVGSYKTIIVHLAADVFDDSTTSALMDVGIELATLFQNPDIVKGIQSIITAVIGLLPGFVEIIPVIANVITAMAESGLLGTMLKLMVVALIMMPVLSSIAAVFQLVGGVLSVIDVLMLAFTGTTLGATVSSLGVAGSLGAVAGKLAFLINPITGIIALIIAIISIFGWWDDIARVLGKTFTWFGEILDGPIRWLTKFVDLAGKGLALIGDILGSKLFGSEYTAKLSQEELDHAGKNSLIGGWVPKTKGGTPSGHQLGGGYSSPVTALNTLGLIPSTDSHADLVAINESLKGLSSSSPSVSNITYNYYVDVKGDVNGKKFVDEIDAYNISQVNRST